MVLSGFPLTAAAPLEDLEKVEAASSSLSKSILNERYEALRGNTVAVREIAFRAYETKNPDLVEFVARAFRDLNLTKVSTSKDLAAAASSIEALILSDHPICKTFLEKMVAAPEFDYSQYDPWDAVKGSRGVQMLLAKAVVQYGQPDQIASMLNLLTKRDVSANVKRAILHAQTHRKDRKEAIAQLAGYEKVFEEQDLREELSSSIKTLTFVIESEKKSKQSALGLDR